MLFSILMAIYSTDARNNLIKLDAENLSAWQVEFDSGSTVLVGKLEADCLIAEVNTPGVGNMTAKQCHRTGSQDFMLLVYDAQSGTGFGFFDQFGDGTLNTVLMMNRNEVCLVTDDGTKKLTNPPAPCSTKSRISPMGWHRHWQRVYATKLGDLVKIIASTRNKSRVRPVD